MFGIMISKHVEVTRIYETKGHGGRITTTLLLHMN